MHPSRYLALVILFLLSGCTTEKREAPLFKLLSPNETGVKFANTITTSDSLNVQTDVYIYNGAGVAVGDINNDGLPDIFFAGNMVSSRLYLNKGGMHFEDITEKAGVTTKRWATGATMVDINNDGYLDIYVSVSGPEWSKPEDRANLLFVNNKDGTFTESAARYGIAATGFTTDAAKSKNHTRHARMGVDVADFNNDGRPDIIQADMMPSDLARRKRMSGFMTEGNLLDTRSRGFRDDYSENSLQLNNGVTRDGNPVFSVIARMAGVAHTDWSWSALFADFDNDGYKDIFIGNGYPKAVNDLDYMNALFGARERGDKAGARRLLKDLPGYELSNYVFRNNGDLTFTDMTKAWGMDQQSYSYGAAYADLDNDGKLDLVVNNIDAPAFIYKNVANDDAHYY